MPNHTDHKQVSFKAAWPALAGLSAVFLFEMLDNSILNVALPTIGRDLHASATSLQWITGAYALVFGGLMLAFGGLADKFGHRKIMLIGLALLALASFMTVFVRSSGELIAVRMLMGIAAAMTTPGSMALTFRLFDEDSLRVRAISLISTVGLVGLAIGPPVGGFLLAIVPWQALLLINVPIALLAYVGIRLGVMKDEDSELHSAPVDVLGSILGTLTIIFVLVTPTLFVNQNLHSILPWASASAVIASLVLFIFRERKIPHPIINFKLVRQPLVSSGLAYKAATGISVTGLFYLVTLQLQLDWGWSAGRAAVAMLPQVVTLLATGPFVERFISRVGIDRALWLGALSVISGLLVFGILGHYSYPWVALTLVLTSAGLRVVGVVAGLNVLKGVPKSRISVGAAMTDTADEVASAMGVAVSGTVIAAIFVGTITRAHWNRQQAAQFNSAVLLSSLILAGVASSLVIWAYFRIRKLGGSNELIQISD
jgi:MFS family permease